MWGRLRSAASAVNATERRGELLDHIAKGRGQSCPPSDQDVIVTGAKCLGRREPHHFAKPPPHPITLDRVADLPRHCEADARRSGEPALARLQDERVAGSLRAFGGGLRSSSKIRPPFQPFHENAGFDFDFRIAGANGENRAQAGAPKLTR